jgi:uncharacterized protein HemX
MTRRRTERPQRRSVDAEKTKFSVTTVAAIVVWVLALAAQWYGMQGKFAEINTALSIIAKQMEGDTKLAERDATARDARIRELEVAAKAYEIRLRQLENENARRGGK